MTSETRVGVLAVIDRQLGFSIASDYAGASDDHRDLLAVRAAVAELIEADKAYDKAHDDFVYKVGATVKPDRFDPDWRNECAPGIHFFITRIEAENY